MIHTYPQPPDGSIDPTRNVHPEEFYSYPARFKAEWVSRYCPHGRLLEVGCGYGYFLRAAKDLGYEVEGLEPDPVKAKYVRDTLGIPVEQNLVETNSLPKESFDVVYHCDLLAHFPDPKAAIREMSSLLRPGGVLSFEVGFEGNLAPYWYRFNEWMGGIELGPHRWFWSEQSLDRLLDTAGLQVERIRRFGLGPESLTAFAKRLLIPATSRREKKNISSPPEKPKAIRYVQYYLVRYRAGALIPGWGPQTVFVVAGKKR